MNDLPDNHAPGPGRRAEDADEDTLELMQQLTVYINETDHLDRKPLYLKILELVKAQDAAGATMLKGMGGYSASSHAIHTAGFTDIRQNLPLVIIIVDTEEKIKDMLLPLERMVRPNGGLITVQNLEGHCYVHPSHKK